MAQAGDDDARARFVRAVYEELRVIAQRQRRQSSAGNTLNTTAVVHEAYEKLVGRGVEFNDRKHFFGFASRAMRDVLVDYARSEERRVGKERNHQWAVRRETEQEQQEPRRRVQGSTRT